MQHIIRKQIIQLELGSSQDSFRIQQIVSDHYWKEIIPVLQKVFDAISKNNEIISLDRLEIDLGAISVADIEQGNWVDRLEASLKEQLVKILREANSNKAARREPSAKNTFRQWLYYMENGFLPWNVLKINQAWYDKTLQTLAADFASISTLRQSILTNPQLTERIILQHPDNFLVSLVETLTAEKQNQLSLAIMELYEIFYALKKEIPAEKGYDQINIDSKKDFIKNIWILVLRIASKNEKNTSTEILVERILLDHIIDLSLIKKINKNLYDKLIVTKSVLQKLYPKSHGSKDKKTKKEKQEPSINQDNNSRNIKDQPSEKQAEVKKTEKNKKENQNKNEKDKISNAEKEETKNPTDKSEIINPTGSKKINKESRQAANDNRDELRDINNKPENPIEKFLSAQVQKEKPVFSESIDEDGVFVQHAGIVLLHPFLNSFFNRLELLAGNDFADQHAQQLAMQLLYFLGTGNQHPNEYELVIAKLLCAYPLQQPVETGIEIPEEALLEANDLIAAAISQWEILKNSSVAALREGFLQRNGKLFSKNGRLYLIVEKSAIDILLDRLPWNLSMIKLPWMNEILWVEWR